MQITEVRDTKYTWSYCRGSTYGKKQIHSQLQLWGTCKSKLLNRHLACDIAIHKKVTKLSSNQQTRNLGD